LGTGNNIAGFEDLLYILFKHKHISLVDKSGGATFQNQASQAFGQLWISILILPTLLEILIPGTKDMDNALDSFINGQVAFFFGYSYHYRVIKARAPQLNVSILPMLQLNPEQPVNVANYWVQSVLEKSKKIKNEAWGLLNFLAHSKATKDYLDQSWGVRQRFALILPAS